MIFSIESGDFSCFGLYRKAKEKEQEEEKITRNLGVFKLGVRTGSPKMFDQVWSFNKTA